jgi:hypothetical protein
MVSTGVQWRGRSKQVGGRFRKLWGRMTRNADCEFGGDLLIIAGKLEAYYASGGAGARGARRQSRIGSFIERRRSFHVVA